MVWFMMCEVLRECTLVSEDFRVDGCWQSVHITGSALCSFSNFAQRYGRGDDTGKCASLQQVVLLMT